MNDTNRPTNSSALSSRERRLRNQRRRKRKLMMRIAIFILLLISLFALLFFFMKKPKLKQLKPKATSSQKKDKEQTNQKEADDKSETPSKDSNTKENLIAEADFMAAGYDYDGAIAKLQTYPDYANDTEINQKIASYNATKATCVPADVNQVPHIFYHSLINDTARTFDTSKLAQSTVDGFNAWMTTVEEFDKITQQMYDRGYVFVRLRDLVVETKDENGIVHFTPNTNLLLPPGKKPVVLSLDDLSYYHSYAAEGYPDKLVLDDEGNVKCLYTDGSGTTSVGNYDVVPRLNDFLKAHPDGAYKGARGLIALTGYNGVFGYRTDSDYHLQQNLQPDQRAWLHEHPDFDYEKDIADAKVIADALKSEGWEFASHTWGHLSVTGKSVETLQTDNEKWMNTVANIVGPVDTIIFAHGNDIGDWHDYAADNAAFNYYKSVGYNFFCNVDGSTPYWLQIRDNYVRQGRINLDGYMLYKALNGQTSVTQNMFDVGSVFDSRRPTPVVANGKS